MAPIRGPARVWPGVAWQRALGVFVIALAATDAAGVEPSGDGAGGCLMDWRESRVVAAAINGDTVRLDNGMVVRLAGVEAPRPAPGAAGADRWPPAVEAQRHLSQLVAGMAVVLSFTLAEPDRYGRRRAQIWLDDGRWLQGLVVAAGLARVRRYPGESDCLAALLAVENGARTARLGLWASPEYAVRRAGDPSLIERNGLYEVVEGRVESVGHGRTMVFVDFGRDYRRDFTIMLGPAVAGALAEAGVEVDGLVGRRVRVRGVIEASGGPAIRLGDPGDLEFLDDGKDAGERD